MRKYTMRTLILQCSHLANFCNAPIIEMHVLFELSIERFANNKLIDCTSRTRFWCIRWQILIILNLTCKFIDKNIQ